MATINALLHRHLLWLIIAAYALAAAVPSPGDWIRRARLFDEGAGTTIRLPAALLAILLFIAGQTVNVKELVNLVKRPFVLLAGLLASLVVPIVVVAGFASALAGWHDPGETRSLVLGLAIVAAMPIAGSSAAWSRHFGGSTALSLGLVVVSTVLSPLTTPLALTAFDSMREHVVGLSGSPMTTILVVSVVFPSLAGMALRSAIGEPLHRLEPPRKFVASLVLLILCYSNATASLPAVVHDPDWDYLALVVAAAAGLCFSGFAAGWVVGRIVKANREESRSLVFGLGMTNNGTGLVLAGAGLAGLPEAMLPVIVYNLIQHVLAGWAGRCLETQAR
ncbi:MAG: bile acid:sodium symporter [Gemmataceae bacterium]